MDFATTAPIPETPEGEDPGDIFENYSYQHIEETDVATTDTLENVVIEIHDMAEGDADELAGWRITNLYTGETLTGTQLLEDYGHLA